MMSWYLRRLLCGLVTGLALTGCSTYAATRYSISATNVSALRAFRGTQVAVGPFTAATPGRTDITCRGVGPIKTPDGEPFEEFMRKALIAELTIAEVYAPAAPVTLTGRLDRADFSSGICWRSWSRVRQAVARMGLSSRLQSSPRINARRSHSSASAE